MSGARARARELQLAELLTLARRQLAEVGAAGLSVRAVARDAGLVSSAVYRYFPSRDHLLTLLITEAYNDLGAAVESADAVAPVDDRLARWQSATRAIRQWALDHPHQYALIYGSPVPGYIAPETTIGPATRSARVLMRILDQSDARRRGGANAADRSSEGSRSLPPPVRADMVRLAAAIADDGLRIDATQLARGVSAWIAVFGLVSFELFGQLNNVIADRDAYFEFEVDRLGRFVLDDATPGAATAGASSERSSTSRTRLRRR